MTAQHEKLTISVFSLLIFLPPFPKQVWPYLNSSYKGWKTRLADSSTPALHWLESIHFHFYLRCSCHPSLGQIESDYAAPIAFSRDLASHRLVQNATSAARIYKAGGCPRSATPPPPTHPPPPHPLCTFTHLGELDWSTSVLFPA